MKFSRENILTWYQSSTQVPYCEFSKSRIIGTWLPIFETVRAGWKVEVAEAVWREEVPLIISADFRQINRFMREGFLEGS